MINQSIITIAIDPIPYSPSQMQRKTHTAFCVDADIFYLKCASKNTFFLISWRFTVNVTMVL